MFCDSRVRVDFCTALHEGVGLHPFIHLKKLQASRNSEQRDNLVAILPRPFFKNYLLILRYVSV